MNRHHEEHRVDMRALLRVGMALAAVLVVLVAIMYGLWLRLPKPPPVHASVPPGARLQVHAVEDRAAIQARQAAKLERYGWTDAGHRTAQVPIERAMDILAGRSQAPAAPEQRP